MGDNLQIAVMQPYFFPYIGYFQLINAVDKFVFYDDVNFIKNGWINRNRILIEKHAHYLTVQLKGASSFKQINEVGFFDNRAKLLKTISQNYKKAPFYNNVMTLLESCLSLKTDNICEQAIFTIISTCQYLSVNKIFEYSSVSYPQSKDLEKVKRLIYICKENKSTSYINPIGGRELYNKEDFSNEGILLSFLQSIPITYKQFSNQFVENLSIIDVMMFNSPEEILKLLNSYEIV